MAFPPLSLTALLVLRALTAGPTHAYAVCKATGRASGTVGPLLARWETWRWVESEWEIASPLVTGRGRRRYYKLTPLGRLVASEAERRLEMVVGARR